MVISICKTACFGKCGIIDITPASDTFDGNFIAKWHVIMWIHILITYITRASRKGENIGSKLLFARQLVINITPYATADVCFSYFRF